MVLKITHAILATTISLSALAQEPQSDTVIVPLARTSQIIFTIQDRSDLEILRHYNYQGLFEDILEKLKESDSLRTDSTEKEVIISREDNEEWEPSPEEQDNEEDEAGDKEEITWEKIRHAKTGKTWQSTNVDLGTNNFLAGDQFPDGSEPYAVRPWGSWYLGVNSVQRTKLGRNVFVEWGLGVSLYSFKFEEGNIVIQKDETGLQFLADTRDVYFIKSKLSATFINASLIPMLDFGDNQHAKHRMWERNGSGFRFGIGPYAGYRIASSSKLVYNENGHREKDKNRDSFYLNNLRYGLRAQLGLRSTDLFINYDMNDFFAKEKGPQLNAISFGFIF